MIIREERRLIAILQKGLKPPGKNKAASNTPSTHGRRDKRYMPSGRRIVKKIRPDQRVFRNIDRNNK